MNERSRLFLWSNGLAVALVSSIGCAGTEPTEHTDRDLALARAAGDPVVTSTLPSQTEQGTTLDVRVLGSGFENGSKVTLLLDGVPTSKVVTNSTRYVSGKELVANITVAPDAVTDAYDVQVVTLKGKKGIGTELFEVRTITALPTLGGMTGYAQDVNDAGVVTGAAQAADGSSKPFVWSEGEGTRPLPLPPGYSTGRGRAINSAAMVAGSVGSSKAVRWVPNGTGWVVETLGNLGAPDGFAEVYDLNDDNIVVGYAKNGAGLNIAYRWSTSTGMVALPMPASAAQSYARSINRGGDIAGHASASGSVAVVWTAEAGAVTLPLAPEYSSALAMAINDLRVVVGRVYTVGSSQAWVGVRWQPDPVMPNRWREPELLVTLGQAGELEDIDNTGRIVGWKSGVGADALLWEPGVGVRLLGGLTKTGYDRATAINNPGPGQLGMIAGQSDGGSRADKAVVWWLF